MSTTPLATFEKLNDRISIHRPKVGFNASSQTKSSDPDLIVFCSWVGAATKHIAKYTDTHQRFFPKATILLIRSSISDMFKHADLDPAYEVLASSGKNSISESPRGNSVVLHAFSNGGARSASLLATAFVERHGSCPFDVMILDCCPGQADVSSVKRAITLSLPNTYLARQVGAWFIYAAVLVFMLYLRIRRIEDSVSLLRRTLNDPNVVPRSVPRLYLYSKVDNMVNFEDVHAHAESARQVGYEVVREERFERASHCALINEDSERYWGSVRAQIDGNYPEK